MESSVSKRKPAAASLPAPSSKRRERDDEVVSPCFDVSTDSSTDNGSSHPARFLFYERGEWKDFSQETSFALVIAFRAGHRFAKFTVCGSVYLLSFTRKLQVNLDTGFCRSVGWIDVNGKRIIPSRHLAGYWARGLQFDRKVSAFAGGLCPRKLQAVSDSRVLCCNESNSRLVGNTDYGVTPSQVSLHADLSENSMAHTNIESSERSSEELSDDEFSSDSVDTSSTITSSNSTTAVTSSLHSTADSRDTLQQSRPFPLLDGKLTTLKASDLEFEEVKKRFLAGLAVLANHATITNISKNCHRTTSGHVRYEAFKQQECLTRRLRGAANIRHAWYATSKNAVSGIVLHGFGQPRIPRDGAMYGVGIYLAPERHSNAAAVYSDVDENGEQHVVLCRVIMGNMEQVARGSMQFHPGTEDYDGGVDNLDNPRQYIVWSTHMNTHILPEYVVSFKLTPPWQGVVATLRGKQKPNCNNSQPKEYTKVEFGKTKPPRSSWMSIDMLLLLLKSSLSLESMSKLQTHHTDLKGGRLSSSDFISRVRSIAGDGLVRSTLKSMQTHVLGAVVLQNLLASGQHHILANGDSMDSL